MNRLRGGVAPPLRSPVNLFQTAVKFFTLFAGLIFLADAEGAARVNPGFKSFIIVLFIFLLVSAYMMQAAQFGLDVMPEVAEKLGKPIDEEGRLGRIIASIRRFFGSDNQHEGNDASRPRSRHSLDMGFSRESMGDAPTPRSPASPGGSRSSLSPRAPKSPRSSQPGGSRGGASPKSPKSPSAPATPKSPAPSSYTKTTDAPPVSAVRREKG